LEPRRAGRMWVDLAYFSSTPETIINPGSPIHGTQFVPSSAVNTHGAEHKVAIPAQRPCPATYSLRSITFGSNLDVLLVSRLRLRTFCRP
jgi:hypothetical protein